MGGLAGWLGHTVGLAGASPPQQVVQSCSQLSSHSEEKIIRKYRSGPGRSSGTSVLSALIAPALLMSTLISRAVFLQN